MVASASSPAALTRWRTSGVGSARQAQSNGGFGLGLGVPIVGATADDLDDIDPETPLPTFEVQPAMLAVDLLLLPGESRSCVYHFFFLGWDRNLMRDRYVYDNAS